MGAGQSGGVEIGGSSLGYQVLRVYPNSPGSRAGLKAYFDFIVAIGNTRFNKEDGSLREILKASVDQKLKMIVFNTRNRMAREVEIVPTTSWGGSGLLGVSIKHSSFDKADERVWHVVEVDPGSPASQAGFKAGEDYVIGSDSILQDNDDLYNLIEAHEGKALKLFVYNVKTDNCREVICNPSSRWGGRGYLGCEFGHGLLHRIPYTDNQASGGDSIMPVSSTSSANQPSQPQTNGSLAPRGTPSMQSQQQLPHSFAQMPTQPGHQLFQQALFNQPPPRQQQHQQQQQPIQPANRPPVLPQPPPAPKTFAQLASAQFQANQQSPPASAHQSLPPPPQQPPQAQQPQQPQLSPSGTKYNSPDQQGPESGSSQAPQQQSDDKQNQPPSTQSLHTIPYQTQPDYNAQQSYRNFSGAFVSEPKDLIPPQPQQQQTSSAQAGSHHNYPMPHTQTEHTQQCAPSAQQYYGFQANQQQAPSANSSSSSQITTASAPPPFSYQSIPPPPSMYPPPPPNHPAHNQQQHPPPPPPPQQTFDYSPPPQQLPSDSPYNQLYK